MDERDEDALVYERLTGIATKLRLIARVVELRRNGEPVVTIAVLMGLHVHTVEKYLFAVGVPPKPRGPFARRHARLRRELCRSSAR